MIENITFVSDSFDWLDENSYKKIQQPQFFPSIVLALFTRWNDFKLINIFQVIYFEKPSTERKFLGELKIISEDICTESNGNIKISLPTSFESLPTKYISLGCDAKYYENIRNVFGEESKVLLSRLNDVGLNKSLQERFINNYYWEHSLIRSNDAERMLRAAESIIDKVDFQERHKFRYEFIPVLGAEKVELDFDFDTQNKYLSKRLYAIIGKNGSGKSTFLKNLYWDYNEGARVKFFDCLPEYSKAFLISTSPYDSYGIKEHTVPLENIFCGLSDIDGSLLDYQGQLDELNKNIQKIITYNDNEMYPILKSSYKVLSKLLPSIDLGILDNANGTIEILYNRLSSGEKSILMVMLRILANIRKDSLLLIDEPELHLHPNATASFISAIYELLEEYESYAIIISHSPSVIREIRADSVFIMERNDDVCTVRKSSRETLGANLSDITDEVFQLRDVPLHYMQKIDLMKSDGLKKSEIIKNLKSENLDLSLSVELYIESLFFENGVVND